ncbi:DUF4838 domain-containing protein [bacterium]|nr:DUF4838 domain-containing protein [bacterium]
MGKRGQLPECAISALAVFSSLSAALPATGNDATAKLPFHLIKDGKATATVVMSKVPPEDAYDIVKAIDLFRHDVARFGIPTGDWIDIPVNNRLYRGRRPKTNRIELVVEKRPLETEDDTVIDFPEEQVMRITGGRSGVIRALFYLLEEFGGVRYLGQGGAAPSHFPSIRELAVPQKRIERRAVFPLSRTTGQSTYAIDCPRRRPYFWGWEAKLGAKARIDARGHSLDKIAFPIEEYARRKQKPPGEIFPILHGERYLPYEKNLRYACNGWQPCFTSEAAVDEAATNILAFLRTFPRTTSIKLNVNDCGNHCECEKCLAVDQGGKVRNMLGYVDRSESYYLWANRLAERVCKEFPDVYFTCIAYREVYEPPSLKLHPRIAVTLLFDLSSWADPEVTKERKELMRRWARKCDLLGFGGYDWGCFCYSLPRVYFREQQEAIRALRDHHGVTLTSSRSYLTMNEGPKMYLYFKLQENPDLDLEETIGDWCRA